MSVGSNLAGAQPGLGTRQLAETGAVSLMLCTVLFAAMIWLLSRRASTRTALGIVRQLRRSGSHSFWAGATQSVWNPAKPIGPGNRLPGPAEASYSLDPDDLVHLTFISKSGRTEQFSGPIPYQLLDEARLRRRARMQAQAVSVYVASLVAGFALGVVLSQGGWAVQVLFGYLAVLATAMLWAIAVRFIHVGQALRHLND